MCEFYLKYSLNFKVHSVQTQNGTFASFYDIFYIQVAIFFSRFDEFFFHRCCYSNKSMSIRALTLYNFIVSILCFFIFRASALLFLIVLLHFKIQHIMSIAVMKHVNHQHIYYFHLHKYIFTKDTQFFLLWYTRTQPWEEIKVL